jgi:hypothetical protein
MNDINPIELGMACIVCIGYIVGKVWIHYKVEHTTNTKETKKPNKGVRIKSGRKSRGVIQRGAEWDNK